MIAQSLSHLSVAAREVINSTAAENITAPVSSREQVLEALQSRLNNRTAAEKKSTAPVSSREQVLFTLQSRPLIKIHNALTKTRRDRLAFEIGMALKPNAFK